MYSYNARTGLQESLHIPTKYRNVVKKGDHYFAEYDGKYYYNDRDNIESLLTTSLNIRLPTADERAAEIRRQSEIRRRRDLSTETDEDTDED